MTQRTFVLVHGAWHTGSQWDLVADLLRASGATVATPTLRGHGDGVDYTEISTMEQYTGPVREAIEAAESPVVLVGHSLGGTTLTCLAETHTEQIAGLVYCTAAMTPQGRSASDILFSPEFTGHPDAQHLFAAIAPTDDQQGIALDRSKTEDITAAWFGDCDEETVRTAMGRLQPVTPMIPFSSVFTTTPERFGSLPRLFIETSKDFCIPQSLQQMVQELVPGADREVLSASHSPYYSMPHELATLLLGFADRADVGA